MEKTELFIPFTKKLAEAAGLEKEVGNNRYFRCLRMKGFFPPEENMEEYAEKLCKLLLDKHEEALLYTERGLRQKLNIPEAEEVIENMKSAWEEDAPNMYTIVSRRGDERVILMGYEDYIEAIIAKKDDVRRVSTFTEIER
jgi:hypothetical protein